MPLVVWVESDHFCYYACLMSRDGKYRVTVNLLRKYLGDFVIASYLNVIQESGYDAAYIKEIEVMSLTYCKRLKA